MNASTTTALLMGDVIPEQTSMEILNLLDQYDELDVEVGGGVKPGCPGKLNGSSEQNYPPEPPEVEVGDIRILHPERPGYIVLPWEALMGKKVEEIEKKLIDAAAEAVEDRHQAYGDYLHDRMKEEGY